MCIRDRYGVKWPCGYDLNISSQGENFIQVDFDTPWCQPESDVVAELSRRFGCTLEHWYAEQGCNFCGCVNATMFDRYGDADDSLHSVVSRWWMTQHRC